MTAENLIPIAASVTATFITGVVLLWWCLHSVRMSVAEFRQLMKNPPPIPEARRRELRLPPVGPLVEITETAAGWMTAGTGLNMPYRDDTGEGDV